MADIIIFTSAHDSRDDVRHRKNSLALQLASLTRNILCGIEKTASHSNLHLLLVTFKCSGQAKTLTYARRVCPGKSRLKSLFIVLKDRNLSFSLTL
eukprot:g36977.t1